MIFLIHGQESFLSYQNLSDTKKRFLKKHPDGYNLSVLGSCDSFSAEAIKSAIKNYSLFSAKIKLVIIKDFFQIKNSQEKEKTISFLKESGAKNSKTEHIIFFETADVSKDPFYPKIKEISSEKKCAALSSAQIEKWIIKTFSEKNISASFEDAKKIIAGTGNDLWQIAGEIEKLISWLKNQEKTSLTDIPPELISKKSQLNIFKTTEAIVKKDLPLALKLISEHLDAGESGLYLFSMIAYQFKTLIKIKSAAIENIPINTLSKKLKIHPFVLKKALSQTSLFDPDDLKKIYKNILASEEKIKKGAGGRDELMQFIMDIF